MLPTFKLLQWVTDLLAVGMDVTPPPGPATHFEFDPEPLTGTFPINETLTVFARDDNGNTDVTYQGSPDFILPSGVCNIPTDNGWSNGVGNYDCGSTGPGTGTIGFVDTVLGLAGTSNQTWS